VTVGFRRVAIASLSRGLYSCRWCFN